MRKEFVLNLKMSILAFACVIVGLYGQYVKNQVLVDWAYVTMFVSIVVGGSAVCIGAIKEKYEDFELKRNQKKKAKA